MILCQPKMALVGFQGRGCADVVQPNRCHPFLLEALLFQWPSIRRCASRTMLEHTTLESNKSDQPYPGLFGHIMVESTARLGSVYQANICATTAACTGSICTRLASRGRSGSSR